MLAKRLDIDAESLGDPEAAHWSRFTARKVALVATPVGLQNSKYILGKWVDGQFGQTGALGLQPLRSAARSMVRSSSRSASWRWSST